MSFLRTPLLQFFLLGALLLLAHRALRPPSPTQIVLSREAAAGLEQDFQRRNGHPPDDGERRLLRDAYLDSEVLYREALARHLDRGDVIIRRRLVQKMDFVLDALAQERDAQLSDDAIAAYYQQHAARYRQPARVSLRHVFIAAPMTSGESTPIDRTAQTRASELSRRLLAGDEPQTLGDPFVRGHRFVDQTESELAAVFGPRFAAVAIALPVGTWSTPIASSYGLHIVQLSASQAAQTPPLSALRERVANDLRDEQRRRTRLELLRGLRRSYDIVQP